MSKSELAAITATVVVCVFLHGHEEAESDGA